MNARKTVALVLCTGNACRSQVAEAFLRHYHGDRYEVHSAGMAPADRVHPLAVEAMAELGLDISGQRPKDVREYLGHAPVRHVVIVCDGASGSCPRIWPGVVSRTFLPFDDPATFEGTEQEKRDGFRRVRDEIGRAMRAWSPEPALGTRAKD